MCNSVFAQVCIYFFVKNDELLKKRLMETCLSLIYCQLQGHEGFTTQTFCFKVGAGYRLKKYDTSTNTVP